MEAMSFSSMFSVPVFALALRMSTSLLASFASINIFSKLVQWILLDGSYAFFAAIDTLHPWFCIFEIGCDRDRVRVLLFLFSGGTVDEW